VLFRSVCRALPLAFLGSLLCADEGMWTFDNPPLKRLQEVYGFTPSVAWLEKVRLASVRFNDGGSGSFVSADGLMLTNHHVGFACVQNLSNQEHDYVSEGFKAPSREKEPPCPGYEVNELVSLEDQTARVLGAVKPAMSDKAASDARKSVIAQIEKECSDKTGLRCDVITFYQGSEYHLYRYKKYTDVRLVFAPEQQAAFFGGDPDNFTYPRHDMDICFFRAYENGKPAKPAAYLPWSRDGSKEGDLVFVSGHPGATARLKTMAQLTSARNSVVPGNLKSLKRSLGAYRAYASRGQEQARRASAAIFRAENIQKASEGLLAALQDVKAMAKKTAEENDLRGKVAVDAELARTVGNPWQTVALAQKKADSRGTEERFLDLVGAGPTPRGRPRLLRIAELIVQGSIERAKPNEVRFEEYRDSNLASLDNLLFSSAPVYDDFEEAVLSLRLHEIVDELGPAHPFSKVVLQGRPSAEVAKEVIAGSKLKDVAVRKALVEGGAAGVAASTDPLIALVRRWEPMSREIRKWGEDEVDAVISRAGEKIARARWKILGKTVPPDATFTLRLSYGTVKGYPAEGTLVQPYTTFYGLFDRSTSFGNKGPWSLPRRYTEHRGDIQLSTPLNFISTADVIGGNSGSPTINRNGEFVGIIFDGNIQSLALDYFYTDEQARAVSVDSRGILEALRKVYDAGALVEELTHR